MTDAIQTQVKKLLIAGGKTGGHLFPGVAVARRFMERAPDREVLFIGTKEGIENKVLPRLGYPLVTVRSAGIRGKGAAAKLRALFLLPAALFESIKAISSFHPDVALGVGGYVSGPALAAAWLLRIPFAIQEQNVTAGLTNRILARFARKIFVSFDESVQYFPARKAIVTGNPVRREIIEPDNGEAEFDFGKFGEGLTLLVFGGSQGARAINRAVVDFFRSHPTIRDHTNLIHQTGKEDFEEIYEAYREMGYQRSIVVPFIYMMGDAYRRADLVLCRSGASTVFELASLGKPAILIPFPDAAGDHQTFNAAALAKRGMAVLIPQKEIEKGALTRALKELLTEPDKLKSMSRKAASMAKSDAADAICAALESLARK